MRYIAPGIHCRLSSPTRPELEARRACGSWRELFCLAKNDPVAKPATSVAEFISACHSFCILQTGEDCRSCLRRPQALGPFIFPLPLQPGTALYAPRRHSKLYRAW